MRRPADADRVAFSVEDPGATQSGRRRVASDIEPGGGHDKSQGDWQLVCARCGDRIGVYERLWWERPDGSAAMSSFLQVRAGSAGRNEGHSFWHAGCAPDDPPPGRAAR